MTAWLTSDRTTPSAQPARAGVPPAPEVAATIFGTRLGVAVRYANLLATAGVERGLLGPREVPRLWDRHLVNCAVVAELVPTDSHVLDVGSGAGLPGIALALARPDLTVTLLEPMARRAAFLDAVVRELGLAGVQVHRGRAEELHGVAARQGSAADKPSLPADVVTARALAPLDRLANWCLPLVKPGGVVLAIKGQSAAAELEGCRGALRRAGGTRARIRLCGVGSVDPPTTVVEIVRSSGPATRPSAR